MNAAGTISGPIKLLTPLEAKWLDTCVPLVRQHYRQNGAVLPPQLRALFADIEAMAKVAPHVVELQAAEEGCEWITTAEVARLLGVSARRVNALGDKLRPRRMVLGKWMYVRSVVLDEVEARTLAESDDRYRSA